MVGKLPLFHLNFSLIVGDCTEIGMIVILTPDIKSSEQAKRVFCLHGAFENAK